MQSLGPELLAVRLAALEIDNRLLRETVLASEIALAGSRAETQIGVADLLATVAALAVSRAETKIGVAELLASVTALASSRAETRIGVAELLASVTALASSRAEMKIGAADLLASETALASSKAETKIGVADLLASVTALAESRAETKIGVADLLRTVTALATLRTETEIGVANLLASVVALAESRAETKIGVADLLASETALASSQAETKIGAADLLASVTALAASRAETKIGVADLLASKTALASSQAETKIGVADLLASETALAVSRAETKTGAADLLASETALASSQAETKTGVADLLASVTALATSRAETKIGVADLLASVTALAVSRAETKIGVADLLATVTALATSRAETKVGAADLLASETANSSLETLARELGQARDAAVHANQAKTRFLAGMSHELRTPLHCVLGYAQLLRQDGGLNEVQSARVTSMLDAGMHLLEMIEGVLDLSEIEAGRVELNVAKVHLRRVAIACIDLIRPAAEAKHLRVQLSVPREVPRYLMTDPKRLRQVLFNLLGNAVKYTVQGKVELRIRVAGEGACLLFEVVDTGPGIPAEHHDRLFQEFARIDADPAGTVEGAGLGLSLSKQLATLMGGLIGQENNPVGGSIFWLQLPLIQYGKAASDPVPALDVRNTPPPACSLRVLVVDDVLMNRDIAASFLRAHGHEVTCAESGAEAVAAAVGSDFDVVLMDVRMPEMDGLEATRRIRALEGARGRVPIVALTAQVFTDQVAACRKAGMDSHLAKPFDPETLLDAVVQAANAGMHRAVNNDPFTVTNLVPGATANLAMGLDLPVLNPKAFDRTVGLLAPETIASYIETIVALGNTLLLGLRGPGELAPNDTIAAVAHKLAGSAGMFGFERVTSLSRRFERSVETCAADVAMLARGLCLAVEATHEAIHTHMSGVDP